VTEKEERKEEKNKEKRNKRRIIFVGTDATKEKENVANAYSEKIFKRSYKSRSPVSRKPEIQSVTNTPF
jgi:hypothetical protein